MTSRRSLFRALGAAALLLCAAVPRIGLAQSFDDVSQVVTLTVLPGWRQADGTHVAGLAFDLRPGWRTYWRAAGSAGISPAFDWRGSDNLAAVTPRWPTPRVFGGPQGQSVGYDFDFVLPLLVRPRAGGRAVTLTGRIDLGVCADICVPAHIDFTATLPPGGSPDPAIAKALADRPRRIDAAARCRMTPMPKGLHLTAELPIRAIGPQEAVVFELPGSDAWITDATTRRSGGTLTATAQIMGAAAIDRSALRITVLSRGQGVEIAGCTG